MNPTLNFQFNWLMKHLLEIFFSKNYLQDIHLNRNLIRAIFFFKEKNYSSYFLSNGWGTKNKWETTGAWSAAYSRGLIQDHRFILPCRDADIAIINALSDLMKYVQCILPFKKQIWERNWRTSALLMCTCIYVRNFPKLEYFSHNFM